MGELDWKFEETFNVEKDATGNNSGRYERFINLLRLLLTDRISNKRPVLCRQHNYPAGWFHIVLQTNSQESITLRIRVENVYLDGYRMSNGQWLEFDSGTQLIPGSTILPFDGGYEALQNVANESISRIMLGQRALISAVKCLATSTNDEQRAWYLVVVIRMFCESIRFEKISNFLSATYPFRHVYAPDWMPILERSWGDLSSALLRAESNPELGFRLPQPNAPEIQTNEEAVEKIGCLQGLWYGHDEEGRVPLMADNYGLWPQGRPMVEVFSVLINEIKGEDTGKLYGEIKIKDGLDIFPIYHRKREHYESISPGDIILLTGPSTRAISAYGSLAISANIMHDKGDPNDYLTVSEGRITWNVYHTTSNEYDKPLHKKIDGQYGSATVNYIVLRDAVQATVELILMRGNGENSAGVFGLLAARNGHFTNESVLFKKKTEEVIDAQPGEVIPLSRSIVAVPLNSSIIIRAKLYDRKSDSSSDDEIANGTAEFAAHTSGIFHKNIRGKHGEIKVKVTWDV